MEEHYNYRQFERWRKENNFNISNNERLLIKNLISSFFRPNIKRAINRIVINDQNSMYKLNTLNVRYYESTVEANLHNELKKMLFIIKCEEVDNFLEFTKFYGLTFLVQEDYNFIKLKNFKQIHIFIDSFFNIIISSLNISYHWGNLTELKRIFNTHLKKVTQNLNISEQKTYFFNFLKK